MKIPIQFVIKGETKMFTTKKLKNQINEILEITQVLIQVAWIICYHYRNRILDKMKDSRSSKNRRKGL